uniref:dihydropyrimidinase n=1 Tax=Strigamia maritima TaxID=126957 RepID=T1IKQ8_STRMM
MEDLTNIFIEGGTIINDDHMFEADILIEDGIIRVGKKVGKGFRPLDQAKCKIIDAKNKYVMPGGIDTNTHMQYPFMNTVAIDDFFRGTVAAIAGGTTMIMDFAIPKRGESLLDSFNTWHEWAEGKVCCDYGLHVGVTWWSSTVEKEMESLVSAHGVNSFMSFMAYKSTLMLEDGDLLRVFKKCHDLGAIAMVHAEDGNIIAEMERVLQSDGIKGPEGHEMSRPEQLESDAVNRAIVIAGLVNCPLYIVQVMSKSAADLIAKECLKGYWADWINVASGSVVFGETIAAGLGTDGTHYYNKCWRHAAGHILSPPLRPDPSTPEYLMELLSTGGLQVTGSSNCTFTTEQKAIGKRDFTKIPNGVNGSEDRLSIVWEKGVMTGKMDPCRFVAVTSTNAAKIFNIYPQKGRIAEGSDADIVIWDPSVERIISAQTHHHASDFNIFEGMRVRGVPMYVICRGKIVANRGKLTVVKGWGKYVSMAPYSLLAYMRIEARDKAASVTKAASEKGDQKHICKSCTY